MADSAADVRIDAQKRRTTRVSQAVPVFVTGVDALGRPFQERTSTVVINCHGCRYQSKHYVLKNMWVTLEVPHSEPHREPRVVRARVTWIQRPRTVRELFQIGVELEAPGNLWGIAFPQHDWFPFPESSGDESVRPAPELPAAALTETAWPAGSTPHADKDNLRILPVAASDEPSPVLVQQMADLLDDAKQQLEDAARESAARAAAIETGPLLAALQTQLEQAAERSVQTIAEAAAKRAVQESLGKTALKTQEHLKTLQRRWNEDLLASIEQAKANLLSRIEESGRDRAAELSQQLGQQLEAVIERARTQIAKAFEDGEAALAQSREALSTFRQQAGSVTDTALEQMDQRFRARAEETQSGWHNRIYADLAAATELWDQRIESSLESAAQRSAERLARHSQATAERLENELGSRISGLGKVFAEATAAAEAKLGSLRTTLQGETARAQGALAQVQSAALGIDEHAAKFEALARNAQQELQRRAATVLEAQSREMAGRAESALAAWSERLQPSIEAAAQQAIARLAPKLDQDLATHLKPAGQAYARLERGVIAVDEALRRQQETIATASNTAVENTRGRLQETIDRMSREIEDAGRASSTKWLAELDARATETSHTTFESLFKTADWYEKKVQTQMQSTLEKGLDQAAAGLRDKAGEISRLFASELDHYNRNYVEHAHSQLEDEAREVFERARQQAAELATESMTELTREAEAQARDALAGVNSEAQAALGHIVGQASAQLAQTRSEISEEGHRLSADFRESLSSERHEAFAATRHDLASLAEASVNQLHDAARAHNVNLAHVLAASSDQAINEYKKRLEAASNSWLLTTVSKLDQQSQQLIQSIAQTAQERLRQACAQVLAEVGENLRQPAERPAPPSAKSATASST